MNTEWIVLALYGLMMAFCGYPMMHMMTKKRSDASEPVGAERVGAEHERPS